MRPVLVAIALLAAVVCAEPARATAFARDVDDLPLMDGLSETGDGFAFETARGRIVRVAASGPVAADAVAAFYAETLPALGWTAAGEGPEAYTRAGERLSISFEAAGDGRLRVVFQIAPSARSTPR